MLMVNDATEFIFTNNFTKGKFLRVGKAFLQSDSVLILFYIVELEKHVLKGYANDIFLFIYVSMSS